MKKNFIAAGLLLALVTTASASFAQTKTPRINKRQQNQEERIAQGVKSGELTAKETEHPEAREAKIQSDKKMAKTDGKVTAQERARLRRQGREPQQPRYLSSKT